MFFVHKRWCNLWNLVGILLLCCLLFFQLYHCYCTKCHSIDHIKGGKAYCALAATLSALETLANGGTNECLDLILQPEHISSFNATSLPKVIRSKHGRDLVASALVQEVFISAIPDFMGNPLEYEKLNDEEICRFVAVLCKRDIILQVASKDYVANPELRHLHDACFNYMEMSILKHIDPYCNVDEFENRIKQSLDRFTGVAQNPD